MCVPHSEILLTKNKKKYYYFPKNKNHYIISKNLNAKYQHIPLSAIAQNANFEITCFSTSPQNIKHFTNWYKNPLDPSFFLLTCRFLNIGALFGLGCRFLFFPGGLGLRLFKNKNLRPEPHLYCTWP